MESKRPEGGARNVVNVGTFYLQVIIPKVFIPACDVIHRPHFQGLKWWFAAVHVGMHIFVAA